MSRIGGLVLLCLGLASCALPLEGLGGDAGALDAPPPASDGSADAAPVCGDGVAEAPEECDLLDLRGETCETRGFMGGNLACAGCAYDETGCVRCVAPCAVENELRCDRNERQRCTNDPSTCQRWITEEECGGSGQLCEPGGGRCFGGDGASCDAPLPAVSLPFTISGADFSDDFTDDHTFSGTGCLSGAGPEVILGAQLLAGETVRLSERGGFDATLSVRTACSDAASCRRSSIGDEPGLTFTAQSDDLYYFVVEGTTSGSQDYEIVLEVAPPGNLCTDPIDGTVLPARATGPNLDAEFTDDHVFDPGTCLAGSGPQIVFARDMSVGETLRISERAGVDTYLHVLSRCADAAPCLRSEDREQDGLSYTAPADGTYFFVVEAVSTSGSRDFDAVLDEPPPGNLCSDPIRAGTLPAGAAGATIDRDFTNDHAFTGSGCIAAGGPEIIMTRALSRGDALRLRERGAMDSVLHVLRGSCANTSACLRSEDREAQGLTFTAPADDVYYFVVEAVSTSGSRDYDAALEPAVAGNVCAATLDASALPATLSGPNMDEDFSDEHSFTDPSCGVVGANELVMSRMMTAGETVRFRETAGIDVSLKVLEACADAATCLRSTVTDAPGLSFTAPATGRYYFVAEAVSTSGSRTFDARLEAAAPGQTCADPQVVSGNLMLSGASFNDFTDDESFTGLGCAPGNGQEVVLQRTLTTGQQVTLEELGSADVILSVFSGDCGPAVTCLDSIGNPETLVFTAPANGVYTFVVESTNATSNSYDIRLTSP